MNRKSKEVEGWVKFPVNDPRYANTLEGGMFVRLVVAPAVSDLPLCCGGFGHIFYDELHTGDDDRPNPRKYTPSHPDWHSERMMTLWRMETANQERWDKKDFPRMHTTDPASENRYLSQAYLAVILMGSAGWSGWDKKARKLWKCRRSDLTPAGLAVYDAVKERWPKSRVTLQTWLDT